MHLKTDNRSQLTPGVISALQGYDVPISDVLEDIMVDVAEGTLDESDLASLLFSIALE